jgi:class 3 adenylate cyclase
MTPSSSGGIVFTDIVGFTEVTDVHGDEVAMELLDVQDQLVRSLLPDGSRVVKELGDGLLLWFPDARSAVVTSIALLARFREQSVGGVPLWVRIGAHWGCPRRRGDDLIGRDVNLAARIAALAGAGELLCSAAAVDAAGPVPDVTIEPLGPVFVKGIAEPIAIHRITAAC